jgi:hypothetical protein
MSFFSIGHSTKGLPGHPRVGLAMTRHYNKYSGLTRLTEADTREFKMRGATTLKSPPGSGIPAVPAVEFHAAKMFSGPTHTVVQPIDPTDSDAVLERMWNNMGEKWRR